MKWRSSRAPRERLTPGSTIRGEWSSLAILTALAAGLGLLLGGAVAGFVLLAPRLLSALLGGLVN